MMMRVRRIEKAEGIVPGLFDVQFDDDTWAHDLTTGQVASMQWEVGVRWPSDGQDHALPESGGLPTQDKEAR